ncbi:hypothetical protein IJE86_03160 [bacterium]|nr:hypothetical protein [bacterium]
MKKKAFSIAEALISLAIIGIAMGAAAPLISKSLKGTSVEASSKWFFTRNAANITRPAGNVGIGVSMNADPTAKLDVKSSTSNIPGLKLTVPSGITTNILEINKALQSVFSINNLGLTKTKGLEINYPDQSRGGINYLTTWKEGYTTGAATATNWRHILTRDGGLYVRNANDSTNAPLVVQNDDNENLLILRKDGSFSVGQREVGAGLNSYKMFLTARGSLNIVAPTREEAGGDDLEIRNDTRALSIRYPQDSDASIDCCKRIDGTHTIGDGVTETAFFNSNGSLYINSINMRSENDWAGHAIEVRTGVTPRAWINTDGQLVLRPKSTAKGDYALIIGKSQEEENNSTNAWIKKDGTAWFKGNVSVDGTIANADLDTKLAKVNKELTETKEVIALLKQQNELMQEKIVALETTLAAFQVQNHIAKNSENKLLGILK